ncbi:MAG: hypothetical protein L0Y56_04265, partial [Nitrospira sp.]|nr:hypothetical protein [Nitrospira sp.]
MPGNYSHTTRADGTTLTSAIYNADHQNHIDNQTPAGTDDHSINVAQMQSTIDPGEVGTESLPSSLAGELERIRFMIKEITGKTQWYETAAASIATLPKLGSANTFTAGQKVSSGANKGVAIDVNGNLELTDNAIARFIDLKQLDTDDFRVRIINDINSSILGIFSDATDTNGPARKWNFGDGFYAQGLADQGDASVHASAFYDDGVLLAPSVPATDVQIFTASGTWTKPAGTPKRILVRAWGGGGSGGRGAASAPGGGGGGGGYVEDWFDPAAFAATESVTVGTGGASPGADSTDGNVGGNTTFSAALTAFGGGGGGFLAGNPGGGGGGGGAISAGVSAT